MVRVRCGGLKGLLLAVLLSFGLVLAFLNAPSEAAKTSSSVNIHPSVTITVPADGVTLALDPAVSLFGSQTFNVNVGSNNPSGYQMVMTSSDTDMINTVTGGILPTLTTLQGGYTESTFETNKWGYKLGSGNYFPMQASVLVSSTNEATGNTAVPVTFATKADFSMPSGRYTTTVNFAVVANYFQEYIQNLDSSLCTTTPLDVLDYRDGQTYTVQRLADGNCWMMSNLNLGATTLTKELNSGNTNITGTISAATFNGWKKTAGTSTSSAGEFIPVSGADSTSGTAYGTLYNYYAATGGTLDASKDATSDICPAGWRLPTSGASGEFSNLYSQTAYNTNAKMRAPISSNGAAFALAGYFANGGAGNQGANGYYWSSTRNDNTSRLGLYLNTSGVNPSELGSLGSGNPIRCMLMPNNIESFNTMQALGTLSAAQKKVIVDKMEPGKSYTLTDTRDSHTYSVAKLDDGKVWMRDNLNLGDTTAVTLTPDDTNIPFEKQLPASSTSCFSSGSCTNGSSQSGNGYTVPAIYTGLRDTVRTNYGSGSGKTGVLYNYCAATAGTYCFSTNIGDAQYDVCPIGWRMPTGGSDGEYGALYTAYSSNQAEFKTALSTPLTGYYYAAYINNQNSLGAFWSSTTNGSATGASRLYVDSTSVAPRQTGSSRYYGFAVRCVLSENTSVKINLPTTMQEFGMLSASEKTALKNALPVNLTFDLQDTRDNKSYKIAKLADGEIWMVSNLNLAGGTALYSDDSDVAPANTRASGTPYYTLPNSSSSGFSSDTVAYVYNTGNETTNCTSSQPCNSYYSWRSATVGGKDASGIVVTDDGLDAAYSICPKGWRLPKSGKSSDTSATSTTGYKKGDFYKLATAYGVNLESQYYQSSAVFYNNAGPGTLPNFLLAGNYYSGMLSNGGSYGYYWSSSSNFSTGAYGLRFNSSNVNSAYVISHRTGLSVRCILRH